MNVIILAGTYDLPYSEEYEYLEEINSFKRNVIKQNKKNTFIIAEIPPFYSWFAKMGSEPPGFKNYVKKIENINKVIKTLNSEYIL